MRLVLVVEDDEDHARRARRGPRRGGV